jgi:hypothetical protein
MDKEIKTKINLEQEIEQYLIANAKLLTEGDSKLVVHHIAEHFFKLGIKKRIKPNAEESYDNEEFEKNRLLACENMTDEEWEREEKFVTDFIEKNHRIPTISDAIELTRKDMINNFKKSNGE